MSVRLGNLPFETEERLGVSLSGSLPCITCGYDLKGISIRSVCPECATTVRATILFRVDPRSEVFRPIFHPEIITVLLFAWAIGALVAAIAVWIPRIEEVAAGGGAMQYARIWSTVAFWAIVASAVGSASFIFPFRSMRPWKIVLAAVGMGGYALIFIGFMGVRRAELGQAAPYSAGALNIDRTLMRLLMMAGVIIVLLGVRPVAREFVKRSLALRTGRVNRQTIFAMVAVALVGMMGDAMRLVAPHVPTAMEAVVSQLGVVCIVISSLLLTLGFASAVVDSWRIGMALVVPTPTLREVLGEE